MRVNRVSQWWHRLTSRATATYVIDLGSATTKVALLSKAHQPRIWHEATCLAWHRSSGTVTSFGDRALKLLGRTPERLSVVFPIKGGVVTDQEATVEYLKTVKGLLTKPGLSDIVLKPKVVGVIPSTSSPIERQLFVHIFEQAGLSVSRLTPALVAVNHHLHQHYPQHQARVVLMIGDQLTQLGVFSQQVPILMKTFELGGRTYTNQVLQVIKSEYGYEVGWQTAEQLKHQLGICLDQATGKSAKTKKMVIRGKSITNYTVSSVSISSQSFCEGFTSITAELIGEIKDALQEVPADVLTTALESGLHLTGGGSLLSGLSECLEQELGCQVVRSKHPQLDTVSAKAYLEV